MDARVGSGFLIFAVAGLAALVVNDLQQDCVFTGMTLGGETFSSGTCQPTYWPLAVVLASSGTALGGYFVYMGVRKSVS